MGNGDFANVYTIVFTCKNWSRIQHACDGDISGGACQSTLYIIE